MLLNPVLYQQLLKTCCRVFGCLTLIISLSPKIRLSVNPASHDAAGQSTGTVSAMKGEVSCDVSREDVEKIKIIVKVSCQYFWTSDMHACSATSVK